jgi:hypothetical protein
MTKVNGEPTYQISGIVTNTKLFRLKYQTSRIKEKRAGKFYFDSYCELVKTAKKVEIRYDNKKRRG